MNLPERLWLNTRNGGYIKSAPLPENTDVFAEYVRVDLDDWRDAAADAPPTDGSHIQVCNARIPFTQWWTFNQRPPAIVHYWSNPGEEGFYLSHGGGAAEESPFEFTHWKPLGAPPK